MPAKWEQAPEVSPATSGNRWESAPVVTNSGTRTEEAMIRAGFMDRQRDLNRSALERAGLPPDASFMDRIRNDLRIIGGNAVSAGRGVVEGTADIVAPFANALGYAANVALPGQPFSYDVAGDTSRALTAAGVPEPATMSERGVHSLSRLSTSFFGGGRMTDMIFPRSQSSQLPLPVRPTGRETAPAQTLMREGIPLDASQRSGGRFAQMLRSAVTNHPFTAGRQADFARTQQSAFNRAVLRSIGAQSDEATQEVMLAAKTRIGDVFNRIGSRGSVFDDALQSELATIVDDALRNVPESELNPLLRNIDDILAAVDENGLINGQAFIGIRSRLSELSRAPRVGVIAGRVEDALIESLERAHPGQRSVLQSAVDQWRNLRIIQSSVVQGAERDISPLRLSNAIASVRNQNMSVYGVGGDQNLVSLAQAGRSVLPQALPDSGTIPRGLMQSPIRAILSAPLYRGAQNVLLRQRMQPGTGPLRPDLVAGSALAGYSQGSGN